MSRIEAQRFASLKARVKAECARRCHEGSVEAYSGTLYDFSRTPVTDEEVRIEHFTKIAEPLKAINSDTVPGKDGGVIYERDIAEMEAAITLFEARSMSDRTSRGDCKTSCTGACYTACYGTCTGSCGDGCVGTCVGGCSTMCTVGCSYSCVGTCSGCAGGCSGCRGSCVGSCSGSCSVSCGYNGCYGACRSSCSNGCTSGCGAACGSCAGNCSGVSK